MVPESGNPRYPPAAAAAAAASAIMSEGVSTLACIQQQILGEALQMAQIRLPRSLSPAAADIAALHSALHCHGDGLPTART